MAQTPGGDAAFTRLLALPNWLGIHLNAFGDAAVGA